MREGVLMHLWGSAEAPAGGAGRYAPKDKGWRTSQVEGASFADPRWVAGAKSWASRGAWLVTVLREPSSRVWSRYFYDGGGPAAKTEAAWLESSNCGGGGRGIGNRCLSNYYVRARADSASRRGLDNPPRRRCQTSRVVASPRCRRERASSPPRRRRETSSRDLATASPRDLGSTSPRAGADIQGPRRRGLRRRRGRVRGGRAAIGSEERESAPRGVR